MAELRPIETIYDGYKFRSRLEARWAVFFDAMGICYEYEPQGFQLASGKKYLPDFVLHGFLGRCGYYERIPSVLWCDVKGVNDQDELWDKEADDLDKMAEFAAPGYGPEDDPYRPLIVLPNIPKNASEWLDCHVTNFDLVDGDSCWPCVICKSHNRPDGFFLGACDGEAIMERERETNRCLAIARQARFEHGETPNI